MNKAIYFAILLILSSSLKAQNEFVSLKYKAIFPAGSKETMKKFFIDIPIGGQIIKGEKGEFSGDYKTEYRVNYSDSSIIYITNDEWSGSNLNSENRYKIGIDAYYKKHSLDTIAYEGMQKNNRYWKEVILGEIVVGYVNCPLKKKELFDKSIKTVRRKRKLKIPPAKRSF